MTPIFDVNEIEKVQEFIIKKKAKLDKKTSNTSKIASEEISFEDEIIPDPSLAALLNEDREIIISDSLYKYTENGMYFCLMKDKQKLYDYLNKVGLSGKLSKNTSTNSQLTSKMALPAVTEVSDGINLFIPIDYYDVVPLVFATNSTVTSGIQTPKLIKQNLGICSIQKQGFFEKIFGASEKDEDYYDDNRRIQISYWNHNYFLFSSIGCSARLQKREKFLGVMYWDKSYADKIELGVNSVQYDYKFNVPQFNQSQYEYNTVFFESNGLKFNISGKIINKMPTDNPGFIFDIESPQDAITITICNNDYLYLSAKEVNSAIDILAKSAVNALPSSFDKTLLQNKIANDKIKYNVLMATPLNNKVTFNTMNVMWTNNNDNVITHYFDFNFLVTWKSTYSSFGNYLGGLAGGTSYSNVSIDMYGAALHNGQWKGKRLILQK